MPGETLELFKKPPKKYLFFDTETTGLPLNWRAPVEWVDNWPRLVQLAWITCDDTGKELHSKNYIIKPDGFTIPEESASVHGISQERAEQEGIALDTVLAEFKEDIEQSHYLVAHNMSFDEKIIGAEFIRMEMENIVMAKERLCTKELSTDFCAIPSANGMGRYKWPKLSELHIALFGDDFSDSHNAAVDISITAKCFWEMKKRNLL